LRAARRIRARPAPRGNPSTAYCPRDRTLSCPQQLSLSYPQQLSLSYPQQLSPSCPQQLAELPIGGPPALPPRNRLMCRYLSHSARNRHFGGLPELAAPPAQPATVRQRLDGLLTAWQGRRSRRNSPPSAYQPRQHGRLRQPPCPITRSAPNAPLPDPAAAATIRPPFRRACSTAVSAGDS
jgi:hypothetical protein